MATRQEYRAIDRLIDKAEAIRMDPRILSGPPKVWGPPMWDLLHSCMDVVPCSTCRSEGNMALDALESMVSVHKGKPPKKPAALCELAKQVSRETGAAGLSCSTSTYSFD